MKFAPLENSIYSINQKDWAEIKKSLNDLQSLLDSWFDPE